MAEPNLPQSENSPTATGTALRTQEPDDKPVETRRLPSEKLQIHGYTRSERWLHRITVLMFVFVCAVLGMLLVILPWRPEWTDNHLLLGYPQLREILGYGFTRGLCTGLGVLDVWIGFWEAIHYHEEKYSK
jgi:hypothetical protein